MGSRGLLVTSSCALALAVAGCGAFSTPPPSCDVGVVAPIVYAGVPVGVGGPGWWYVGDDGTYYGGGDSSEGVEPGEIDEPPAEEPAYDGTGEYPSGDSPGGDTSEPPPDDGSSDDGSSDDGSAGDDGSGDGSSDDGDGTTPESLKPRAYGYATSRACWTCSLVCTTNTGTSPAGSAPDAYSAAGASMTSEGAACRDAQHRAVAFAASRGIAIEACARAGR